jgi:hypothetical protein
MTLRLLTLLAGACVVLAPAAHAQPTPAYDPLKTFGPLTLPAPATTIRSGSGAPGPGY